jgi:hypothetical protein
VISKFVKVLILTLTLVILYATPALSQGFTIYKDIPAPLPGNVASLGYEATSAAEFGDRIAFAGSARLALSATVTMSSWGCQSGSWFANNCLTTPGATFSHPITLNIYSVGVGNQVGALLGSVTQTFAIPFRPSADIHCTGGRWYDAGSGSCFNGKATNITFNLSSLSLTLPNQVIFGVAYNTSHYGAAPIGEGPACYTSSGGCGYDSLNVGVVDPAATLTVGSNPAPDDAYFNTLFAPFYCDSGAGGVGVFRLDAGCWTGQKPSVQFTAAKPPTNKDDCKGNGWQSLTNGAGQSFPNQGQCIQYANTGK